MNKIILKVRRTKARSLKGWIGAKPPCASAGIPRSPKYSWVYSTQLYFRSKLELKLKSSLPGIGPKLRLLKENDSPDLPSGPPGGRGDKNKIKNVLKYSWV